MKTHLTTIVLVVLAAALGLWVWFDRDTVTSGEKKRRESNVFVAFRKDALARVAIQHDGDALELERDAATDGAWRIAGRHAGKADQAAVERLLATLEFATVLRKVGEAEHLGLGGEGDSVPRATGVLQMGGVVVPFVLGGPSPRPEGSSYFRVGTDAPIAVSAELTAALLRPSDDYRDRSVVPWLSLDLARFEARFPGGEYAVERIDEHSFRVASLGVLAARDALEELWGALADMRASAFPRDADVAALTRAPALTLRMIPKDAGKPPATITLGDACPSLPDDVVAVTVLEGKSEPAHVACVPRAVLGPLRRAPASLVERRPFFLRADEFEEFRTESRAAAPVQAIELARKGTGFHARAPEDRDLTAEEADAASDLLARIADAEATEVTAGAGAPFPSVVAKARIRFGDHEQTVEVGPLMPAGDGKAARAVVRRLFDDARLTVGADVHRLLLARVTSLRPRTLLGDTRRVVGVNLRCGEPQDLVDTGGGFAMVRPEGHQADASVLDLVSALTRGKIDLWVSDGPIPEAGLSEVLEQNDCRVVLRFEDDREPRTIVLGRDGEGGIYGQRFGEPAVFVAPASLRRLASRIYVSRASLRAAPDDIGSVRSTFDGVAVGGDAAALRQAVGALYADDVVAIGPASSAALGRTNLLIEVKPADAGPPHRIRCAVAKGRADDRCSVDGLSATFAVAPARLDPFLPAHERPDAAAAGNVARDGGPR